MDPDASSLTYALLALVLLVANGFLVAARFALIGVQRTRINELLKEGNRAAARVKAVLGQLDAYLATTHLGASILAVGLGWLSTLQFGAGLAGPLQWLGLPAEGVFSAASLSFLLVFLFTAAVYAVAGVLIPRALGEHFPETVVLWTSWPLVMVHRGLSPLCWPLRWGVARFLGLLGIKPQAKAKAHSEEELGMILDESRKAGVLTPEERKMLERVFRFHDKTVKEIMVPRPDVVALDLRASEKEIQETAFEEGYSRLPVYDGNLDKIVGIIYVKDLIYTQRHPQLIKIADLVREYIEVPETYPVSQLLRDFQRRQIHLAVVVDEFGATAGLVTLEDIVEEIVGEIRDEHDEEEPEIERLQDGSIIFEGRVHVDQLHDVFPGLDIPEGEFDTIGGLVLFLAGKVPKEGESVRVGDFMLRVVKREGRRIRKVLVRRVPPGASQAIHALTPRQLAAAAAAPVHAETAPSEEAVLNKEKARA